VFYITTAVSTELFFTSAWFEFEKSAPYSDASWSRRRLRAVSGNDKVVDRTTAFNSMTLLPVQYAWLSQIAILWTNSSFTGCAETMPALSQHNQ